MTTQIKFIRLNEEAKAPHYATEGSAGADICYCGKTQVLGPGERNIFGTGLAMEIPVGFEVQVRPRSGLAAKKGLTVLNAPGTIDSDYRGEVGVILANLGSEPVKIENGDRIAQIVVAEYARGQFEVAESLGSTERGDGGFGSTGEK